MNDLCDTCRHSLKGVCLAETEDIEMNKESNIIKCDKYIPSDNGVEIDINKVIIMLVCVLLLVLLFWGLFTWFDFSCLLKK